MDTPLHRYAARHDGVVTRAVAEGLGYPWPVLRTIVRDEGWRRVGRGTYALPGTPSTLRTRVRAEQVRRPVLVASQRTAAALLGGDVLVDGFDFLVEGDGRYDVRGGTVRRTHHLPAEDVVNVSGLVVTSPLRTATDLLRYRPRNEAVVAVDGLLRAGPLRLDAVAAALHTLSGERYVARAWRAFATLDPAAGSVAESLARLAMRDAGLLPRSQALLIDRAGRRVRVDFWFAAGVVVEIEGYAFHSTPEQHRADMARFNELSRLPDVTVLRFSWSDVQRPPAMIAAIRAALATRSRPRAVGSDATPRATGEYGQPYPPVAIPG
jgi:hypothetical protein